MKLGKLARQLLLDLFKSTDGLYTYTLYRRYKKSPSELFTAIKFLADNSLIVSDNEKLSITSSGISYTMVNNIRVKSREGKRVFPHSVFIGPKLNIDSFYIPKVQRNDQDSEILF